MFSLSNTIAALLFHVLRYRRRVVRQNLMRSFPGKTKKWYSEVEKRFYRNLSAVFHEMIFYSKYNLPDMMERIQYNNADLLQDYLNQNRNIMIVAGHCGNWELLGMTLPVATGTTTLAAAKKQSDSYFDTEINRLRTKLGLLILPSQNIYRSLLKAGRDQFVVFLIADQTPPRHELDFWVEFLNQDTPVFTGPETIARKMDMVVVFAEMTRTKQGRYFVDFKLVTDQPGKEPKNSITHKHVALLQQVILNNPDSWLWSHKRWKHKKPPADVIKSSG